MVRADCFSGSLAVLIGAAPPPFLIFAEGFPRRLRRRNAFRLVQEYYTIEEIENLRSPPRFARRHYFAVCIGQSSNAFRAES